MAAQPLSELKKKLSPEVVEQADKRYEDMLKNASADSSLTTKQRELAREALERRSEDSENQQDTNSKD